MLLALILPTLLVLWWQHRHDWVEQPCDLPADWETRTITVNDDSDWLDLTSHALAAPAPSTLLLADATGENGVTFATQVERFGNDVNILTVADWHETAAHYRLNASAAPRVIVLMHPRQVTRKDLAKALADIPHETGIIGICRQ